MTAVPSTPARQLTAAEEAAIAELVGTFILVYGGTAVAVGAILTRPTAGAAYDSLAIALAFGPVAGRTDK